MGLLNNLDAEILKMALSRLEILLVEPNCPRPSGGVKVEYLEVDVNTWSDLPPQPNPYTL